MRVFVFYKMSTGLNKTSLPVDYWPYYQPVNVEIFMDCDFSGAP